MASAVNFRVLSVVCRGANRFTCPNNPALLNSSNYSNRCTEEGNRLASLSRGFTAAVCFIALGMVTQGACSGRSFLSPAHRYAMTKIFAEDFELK